MCVIVRIFWRAKDQHWRPRNHLSRLKNPGRYNILSMARDDFEFLILELHIQKSSLDFEKHLKFKHSFYQIIFELTEWFTHQFQVQELLHWIIECVFIQVLVFTFYLFDFCLTPMSVYVCVGVDVYACNICMCACVWCGFNHTQHVSQSNQGWSLVMERCTQASAQTWAGSLCCEECVRPL